MSDHENLKITDVRKWLTTILALLLALYLSLLLVFEWSFFPSGYEVLEETERQVHIQSNEWTGLKKDEMVIQVTELNSYQVSRLLTDIMSLKMNYFFTYLVFLGVAFFYVKNALEQGPFEKVKIGSGLVSFLFTAGTLQFALNDIQSLMLQLL
ncbi:hypothetical protein EQV77_02485 [Halobacillus fulvus]|nr:hypothetical protein EQV77_02485 [Halobacillus fulvus]